MADMRAIEILTPGKDTGRLSFCKRPIPTPKPHEVLIRVNHAGINRADIFQRKGLYPPPDGAPDLPGLEVAGTIAAMGENISEWRLGEAVCALLPGGGYAEYALAHHSHVLPVPDGWSMAEAAALPEALVTVWMCLHAEAGLKKDETVLIHGGASGIGLMAIQLASWMGATAIATASTPEKCASCLAAGAQHAIAYKQEDFVAAVMEHTAGKGVDVILDMVGGDYIERNFQSLAVDGRMISIAFLRGARLENLNLAPLLLKRLTWKGATLRARSNEKKAEWARQIRATLGPALDSGLLKPRIDQCFAWENVKKAHDYMEENLNIGKIVLQIE